MQPRLANIPKSWRLCAIALFYFVVVALCILAISNSLAPGGFASIAAALDRVPLFNLAASAASVVAVYSIIWIMEQVALRDADAPNTARWRIAVPLIANALAAGAGFGIISGGALRARLYSSTGMTLGTGLFAASCLTLMSILGGSLIASLGLLLADADVIGFSRSAPRSFFRIIGAFGVIVVIGLVLAGGTNGRSIGIAGKQIRLPSGPGIFGRIGLGAVDWIFSALTLYVLLPQDIRPPYFDFVAMFALFQLAALSTGTPAGLGVFEAMMLSFGRGHMAPALMAASLICYRIISFVIPTVLGLIALVILEAVRRIRKNPGKLRAENPGTQDSGVNR